MPHPKFETARRRLVPVAALLVATALGGCVAYTGYPSGYYSYNYPSGYYGGNRGGYAYPAYSSYNQRPVYSSDYNSSFNAYENSGGGR
jgi:hypothetical protein